MAHMHLPDLSTASALAQVSNKIRGRSIICEGWKLVAWIEASSLCPSAVVFTPRRFRHTIHPTIASEDVLAFGSIE